MLTARSQADRVDARRVFSAALFASSQTADHGMTLRVPLTVAAVGYLLAIGLTLAIRADR